MAILGKLGRLTQIGTLPETRGILFSPATRRQLRATARRLVHDRAELARDLVRPAGVRAFAQGAFGHPATRELAGVALLFLPGRYLPIGWATGWATRRIARRVTGR
jgi:hypothetical protein